MISAAAGAAAGRQPSPRRPPQAAHSGRSARHIARSRLARLPDMAGCRAIPALAARARRNRSQSGSGNDRRRPGHRPGHKGSGTGNCRDRALPVRRWRAAAQSGGDGPAHARDGARPGNCSPARPASPSRPAPEHRPEPGRPGKPNQQNRADRSKSQHRFLRPKTVNSTP